MPKLKSSHMEREISLVKQTWRLQLGHLGHSYSITIVTVTMVTVTVTAMASWSTAILASTDQ